jgi:hypothetical protein
MSDEGGQNLPPDGRVLGREARAETMLGSTLPADHGLGDSSIVGFSSVDFSISC